MNLKKSASQQEAVGRLELTMQNIADAFIEQSASPQNELQKVFVTYNARHKTISTVKKALLSSGHPFNETPENCFYDLLQGARELLQDYCGLILPSEKSLRDELASHPSFVFLYSPLLGPQFELIAKKLRFGSLKEASELQVMASDVQLDGLELDGSLRIIANHPLDAKCILRNVKVINRGVDWERSKPFWKVRYQRNEAATIILEGKSTFIAENLTLMGNQTFVVKDGESFKM